LRHAGELRELSGMLSQALIHDKSRKVFAMQILARRVVRLQDHRTMAQAEPGPSPEAEALATILNAIPAAE
jgi:hypothetical protein